MKNLKISKKILALLLTGTMGMSLCACSKGTTLTISSKTDLNTTLESVSDLTILDENLEEIVYEGTTWEEINEEYKKYREAESKVGCNQTLYKMGLMLLRASLAEQLNINVNDIVNVDWRRATYGWFDDFETRQILLDYKEKHTAVCDGEKIEVPVYKSKEILTLNSLCDLLINLEYCSRNARDLSKIDDTYDSFQKYMCNSGNWNKKGDTLNMYLDENKVKAYNSIK